MKNEKITIKPNYSKLRNEMHFNIQLNTRVQIYENKKKYNRKRLKQQSYEYRKSIRHTSNALFN